MLSVIVLAAERADGQETLVPSAWTSSDNAVATVETGGVVTAIAPGVVRIVARAGTTADSVTVTVQRGEGGTIEAFGDTNCGLTVSSGAVCWGHNGFGVTGTRLNDPIVWTPVPVAASVTWRSIDGSWNHVCGVDTQFDAYCWGHNAVGQLGMGTVGLPVIPSSRVVGDRKFVAVSAGGAEWDATNRAEVNQAQQSCGLTREGHAFCWGLAGNFETSGEHPSSAPRAVAPGVRFASISVGNGFACAISIERRAWCWGNNDLGQLGRVPIAFDRSPRPVQSALKFERISAGGLHACALTDDGSAWCWGANESLQLGSTSSRTCLYRGAALRCETAPVRVPGSDKFSAISAGSWGLAPVPGTPFSGYSSHSCGVTLARSIVCWGSNANSQVWRRLNFDEPPAVPPTPALFQGIQFRSVSAGARHTCAVSTDNRAYWWGSPIRGQTGVPSGEVRFNDYASVAGGFVFR